MATTFWIMFALWGVISLGGCSDLRGGRIERDSTKAVIEESDPIRIQETPRALVVRAAVSYDPRGGFLLAEMAEDQVRRYDASGKLLWLAGRRGDGPGEYRSPMAAVRLEDSSVVVFDTRGRVTRLRLNGALDTAYSMPFSRVEGAVEIRGDEVLVSGVAPNASDPSALLHVVNVQTGEIVRSFFPTPPMSSPAVASAMSYAMADVLGDTVVAAFAGIDSIYVFTLDGRRQRSVGFPVPDFRIAGSPPADFRNPVTRAEWLRSFETMSGIWWVNDSHWAVAYKTLIPGGAAWHFAVVKTNGQLVHHEPNSRELLAADPHRGTILTVMPGRGAPNVWQEIKLEMSR